MTDLTELTFEQFEAYRDARFVAGAEGMEPVEMVLVEVSRRGSFDPKRHKRQAFSLVFAGPGAPVLPQQIYDLRHDRLGDLPIFLVPVGPDGDRMLYEAVFT